MQCRKEIANIPWISGARESKSYPVEESGFWFRFHRAQHKTETWKRWRTRQNQLDDNGKQKLFYLRNAQRNWHVLPILVRHFSHQKTLHDQSIRETFFPSYLLIRKVTNVNGHLIGWMIRRQNMTGWLSWMFRGTQKYGVYYWYVFVMHERGPIRQMCFITLSADQWDKCALSLWEEIIYAHEENVANYHLPAYDAWCNDSGRGFWDEDSTVLQDFVMDPTLILRILGRP